MGIRHSFITEEEHRRYNRKQSQLGILAREKGGHFLKGFEAAGHAFVLRMLVPEDQQILLALWQRRYGNGQRIDEGEPDIRTIRKQIKLQLRQEYEQERKARTVKVTQHHNNEQVLIQQAANTIGKSFSTEKNFVDFVADDEILGELKVNPGKGDFEHAFGHLALASTLSGLDKMAVVSIGKKPGKTIVKWFTSEGVALISKIDGQYKFENSLSGFESLHQILGV